MSERGGGIFVSPIARAAAQWPRKTKLILGLNWLDPIRATSGRIRIFLHEKKIIFFRKHATHHSGV